MTRNIVILCFLSLIKAQELPYGLPRYFDMGINEPINKLTIQIPGKFQGRLFDHVKPLPTGDQNLYYLELILDKDDPIHFKILDSVFHKSSTLYFIDLNNNGWVGPYTKDSFYNNEHIISGQMKTKNILIELSIWTLLFIQK